MRYFILFCLAATTSLAQPITENQKLASLCKVWGFLKYYHPNVASGKQDWDQQLIRLIPDVQQAQNKQHLNDIYARLIDSLGTVKRCRKCVQTASPPVLGQQNLDLSFLTDSLLFTEDVLNRLTYLKNNRNQGDNYYVKQDKQIRNTSFDNEKSYADMSTPDQSYRLLALFRYWNIIHYFFPYKYALDSNWNEVLPKLIPVFQRANNPETYQKAIYQLVASIKDSHGFLVSTDKNRCLRCGDLGTLWLPFELKLIDNKAVVTRIYNDSLMSSSALTVGTVISAIDGQSVRGHIDRIQPYISASNEADVLRDVRGLIGVSTQKQAALTIDRQGKDTTVIVARYTFRELGRSTSKSLNSRYPISQMLSDSIGYVNMGHLTQRKIDSVMKPLMNTRAIIFDLRNYPQATLLLVGWYLTDKRPTFAQFTRPNLSFPGVFEQMGSSKLPPAREKPYAGNVIVLVNEDTQSQAEFTAMAFRTVPTALLVGSPTAGADGNISWVPLPGGYRTAFSGIGVFYPDGRETQRVGILPDIVVKPTIEGIRAGRDEVLERAIKLSRGN
ncbi:S41 family peptidase [Fibrella aquatica]|uniref:S41 family peptidase n=1 Tax=Fibrella aquatica TaxID=3242487 RepID=UPI0035227417